MGTETVTCRSTGHYSVCAPGAAGEREVVEGELWQDVSSRAGLTGHALALGALSPGLGGSALRQAGSAAGESL